MVDSLINIGATPSKPEYTETLNSMLSTAAAEWSPEDRLRLVEALRDQRERWNVEQAVGSKKRITSKKTLLPKTGKKKLAFEGLKL